MKKHTATITFGLFHIFLLRVSAEQIHQGALLKEMPDRTQIAEFPEPEFVCRQASSFNRHSKIPGTPAETKKKPNIIMFFTDDQLYQRLLAYLKDVDAEDVEDMRQARKKEVEGYRQRELRKENPDPQRLQQFEKFLKMFEDNRKLDLDGNTIMFQL